MDPYELVSNHLSHGSLGESHVTMAPKNPPKHQDQNVDIALIQQDIQYIKDTQSQIRTELHDFRAFFVTKDQHIAALQQRDDAIQALLVRIQNVEKSNEARD